MRTVFADTAYWIALANDRDPLHSAALRARAALKHPRLVTTDEVLVEVLTGLSGAGQMLRLRAAALVRAVLADPLITVLEQSHETFVAGLRMYEDRPDKSYSMTDCISMAAMRSRKIQDILTSDRHFAQEGFTVLISRS